jgi:ABC-type nickel/cobalt efflux system permease component RcnA
MSSISVGETRTRATSRKARARRTPRHDGAEPWSSRDRVGVAAVLVLGVIGLVIGWAGISDTVSLNQQTRWLGLGIGALMFAGFGMVGWLLVGLRAVAVLRRDVLAELDRRYPEPAQAAVAMTDRSEFGTVTGMRRYHAASCQMLDGKKVTYADAAAHAGAGLAPCPICMVEGLRPPTTPPDRRVEADTHHE